VYTVSTTMAGGCTATGTTTVVVNSLPLPTANNTGPYCDGNTMDLSSSGGVDYDWSGPSGFALANTQNGSVANVNPGMSGAYTVTVTDINGCSLTTTTLVTINGLPAPAANNTGPVCDGSNVDLNSNGGTSYAWNGPGGYNSAVQNPTIASNMASNGNYTVTITDANNCSVTATTNLTVNALPLILANTNAPLCNGSNVILNGNGGFNYAWVGPNGFNTNGQSPVINNIGAADNGTYTVTGTDANNCSNTATVIVTTFPNPTALFVGDNLLGCAPLCVNFSDQSNGNGGTITSWSWTVEGQNPSVLQNPTFCFNNPGSYDAALSVTTSDGCTAQLSLANYVTVSPDPVAEFMFTPEEIDISSPEVTFASTSTGATSWNWLFGDGGNSTLENPKHMYADTGTFCILLTVSNNSGCTDTATGCLYIEPVFSLYIPNSFTPNDDGLNETFNVYGNGIKTIMVRIYDRWGEEIFIFDNLNKGWPGTRTSGELCKQDVYVYRIEVVDGKNDSHEYMGQVNLIR
jgi:gliding motility-associated-like protein